MKIVSMKCPECGANLEVDEYQNQVRCEYCNQLITIDYENSLAGKVNVDGIETNAELIKTANELLELKEFLKAKKKFIEYSEKCPDKYQGWWGLLICRTRNFTIRDNNILFENDINNFYQHFLKTAPSNIKKEYSQIVENYLHPQNSRSKQHASSNFTQKIFEYKGISESSKSKLLIGIGIFFLITNIATGCGFFLTIAGLFKNDKICKKLDISEKDAKILITVFYWVSAFLFFVVDMKRIMNL